MYEWLKYLNMFYVSRYAERVSSDFTKRKEKGEILSRFEYCRYNFRELTEFFWIILLLFFYGVCGTAGVAGIITSIVVGEWITLFVILTLVIGVMMLSCYKKYQKYLEEMTDD